MGSDEMSILSLHPTIPGLVCRNFAKEGKTWDILEGRGVQLQCSSFRGSTESQFDITNYLLLNFSHSDNFITL